MKVDLFNILFKEIINDLDYGVVLFNQNNIIYGNNKSNKILNYDSDQAEKPSIFRIINDNFPDLFNQFELSFLNLIRKEINSFELSNASKQSDLSKIVYLKVSSIDFENETYFVMEINNPTDQIRELIKKNLLEVEKLKRELFKSQHTINNSYQLIEDVKKERRALQAKIAQLEQEITYLEKQVTHKTMELTLKQSMKKA